MAEEHHMNKGPAVSPQGEGDGEKNRRQQSGSSSSGLQSSGTARRTKTGRRAAGETAQVWDEATAGIRSLKENTDEYVRKNPTKAVFTALAIGFVFGLMRHR